MDKNECGIEVNWDWFMIFELIEKCWSIKFNFFIFKFINCLIVYKKV